MAREKLYDKPVGTWIEKNDYRRFVALCKRLKVTPAHWLRSNIKIAITKQK